MADFHGERISVVNVPAGRPLIVALLGTRIIRYLHHVDKSYEPCLECWGLPCKYCPAARRENWYVAAWGTPSRKGPSVHKADAAPVKQSPYTFAQIRAMSPEDRAKVQEASNEPSPSDPPRVRLVLSLTELAVDELRTFEDARGLVIKCERKTLRETPRVIVREELYEKDDLPEDFDVLEVLRRMWHLPAVKLKVYKPREQA